MGAYKRRFFYITVASCFFVLLYCICHAAAAVFRYLVLYGHYLNMMDCIPALHGRSRLPFSFTVEIPLALLCIWGRKKHLFIWDGRCQGGRWKGVVRGDKGVLRGGRRFSKGGRGFFA